MPWKVTCFLIGYSPVLAVRGAQKHNCCAQGQDLVPEEPRHICNYADGGDSRLQTGNDTITIGFQINKYRCTLNE